MTSFNRHSTAAEVAASANLTGRQVVLTGATSGLGRETASALAATGADLVLGVRDLPAGRQLAGDLEAGGAGKITALPLDLADLDTVIGFAEQINGPVHVLINNAGVSLTPESHLPNGLDVRFATNHLGHFLLALKLHSQMAQEGARLVVLSSAAHKGMPVQLDDLNWQDRPHHKGAAYGESKSANILFAREATRRWAGQGIFANAVLPGSVMTGLQRYHGEALKRQIGFIKEDGSFDEMVKSIPEGAATTVWGAVAPELEGRGGLVLEDCGEAEIAGPDTHPWSGFDPSVADPAVARELWHRSLALLEGLVEMEAPL